MTGGVTALRQVARSRDAFLLLLVGAFTVVLAGWELSVPLADPLANIVSNAGMLVPGAAALWLAWRTARDRSLSAELGRAWLWLAWSLTVFWLGDLAYFLLKIAHDGGLDRSLAGRPPVPGELSPGPCRDPEAARLVLARGRAGRLLARRGDDGAGRGAGGLARLRVPDPRRPEPGVRGAGRRRLRRVRHRAPPGPRHHGPAARARAGGPKVSCCCWAWGWPSASPRTGSTGTTSCSARGASPARSPRSSITSPGSPSG